jgi:hypothetical protein
MKNGESIIYFSIITLTLQLKDSDWLIGLKPIPN